MGVQLDANKADGKKITVNWVFPDIKEKHALYLENSVLNHIANYADKNPDVTVTLDRATLNLVLSGQQSFEDVTKAGKVMFTGDQAKFAELMGMLVDLNQSFWFNIVTP